MFGCFKRSSCCCCSTARPIPQSHLLAITSVWRSCAVPRAQGQLGFHISNAPPTLIQYPCLRRPPAGERLVGELAPELAPMLAALEMPANFVPTTNAVLAEMQRRGISRDTILSELRRMGAEIPGPSVQMLQVPSLMKPVDPKRATGSRAGLLYDRGADAQHTNSRLHDPPADRQPLLLHHHAMREAATAPTPRHGWGTVLTPAIGNATAVGGQGGGGRAHHQRLQHGVHRPHAGGGAGVLRRVARHHQPRQLLPRVHRRAGAAVAVLPAFQLPVGY
jgi:hypothetical protein